MLSKAQGLGSSSVKLRGGSLFMNVGKSEKRDSDIRQTPHVNINPFTPDSMFLHNSEGQCRRRKRTHWNEWVIYIFPCNAYPENYFSCKSSVKNCFCENIFLSKPVSDARQSSWSICFVWRFLLVQVFYDFMTMSLCL